MKVFGILCGLSSTVFGFAYLKLKASKCKASKRKASKRKASKCKDSVDRIGSLCKESVDRISNLPDPILHLILSRVPTTEEVVRTSILSTRWRHLWSSVSSVDINYSRGPKAPQQFDNFVHSVLEKKLLDLDSFRLSCGNHFYKSTVGRWIDAAVRKKVKLLDLKFWRHEDEDLVNQLLSTQQFSKVNDLIMNHSADEYSFVELPNCLATCTSLEALRLSLGGDGVNLLHLTGLSALRVLELNTCWLMNKNAAKGFFKSCPLLEDLSLINCTTYYFDVLCISSPNLQKLRIDNGNIRNSEHNSPPFRCGYEDMCPCLHICCPKLEYLEIVGHVAEDQITFESLDSLKKAVIHLEDDDSEDNDPGEEDDGKKVCELLSGISHVEFLSLHLHFTNKNTNLEDLPKSLPYLKTLELNMTSDVFHMNVLVQILTSSPNIESLLLIIKEALSHSSSPTQVPDVNFPSGHIFEQLKTVKMTGGRMTGAVHEIGFIKYLLKSSKVLDSMIINPSVNMMTDDKLRFLTDNVQKFPRASPEAGIIFVQD